jgi:hypothetical protein
MTKNENKKLKFVIAIVIDIAIFSNDFLKEFV